ncbi:MAG TPA: 50S ribosomal protein L11 methyltransferase [Clostridiales bacterium]|nr:50S ribosomal protein L11 methyltransferase [Clostridiales bacterium]
MAYFVCEVKTEYQEAEAVVALLTESGAAGCATEGAAFIRDAIAGGQAEIWDSQQWENEDQSVTVQGFFADDQEYPEKKQQVIAALAIRNAVLGDHLTPRFFYLKDETWQDGWKQYYKPFKVGQRFVVKPTWEAYAPAGNDLVLELDPGLAFGTGSHPTTAGALSLLERYVCPGDKVIDCGCGSGILAVAAGLLKAKKVYAVDIDHEAILATVKNARINGLLTAIEVFHGDATKKDFHYLAPFQVVVANIVADVILPLLPHIAPWTEKNGVLIAGGIISHRKEEVYTKLAEGGFAVDKVLTDGEWVTLAAVKE